ncbi:hypothetical protein SUNI508_02233 [Seiridium unicorne]|uniref:2EXR domain-containing protein n=1 Tax=Seiridium unicorne TaxID=138068 RepID=A0ABR2UIE3_9PEZI
MSTFYELRMLNKMSQYSIKENAQSMLKAHDDWKTGKMDEAELGRRIRLSRANRSAVISTMVNVARIMQSQPKESRYILTIIEMCGEIVSIAAYPRADKPTPLAGFPSFLKLPNEIRFRIYDFYLNPNPLNVAMMPYKKQGHCRCAAHNLPAPYAKRNISLALASRQMRDEVLAYFYKDKTIFFSCACEMGVYLRNNLFMRQHIRKIKFQWWGDQADKGILELRNCFVEALTVVISRLTMAEPTHREAELRRFFARLRNKLGFPEALGFEELSALRGLQEVNVELASKKRANDVCTSEDKHALSRWLQKLKEPAQD